jgi:hypothetical protein
MEFDAITLRDAVLAVVGLLGIYLAVLVLRLVRLRKRRPAETVAEPPRAPKLDVELDDVPADDLIYAPPPVPRPAAPPASAFGAEMARSQYDAETRQLREEVAQLREDVGQLRAELADLKAARLVSPQYSEAMAMAQRGLSAQDVADRCGISLGEAELVWALARGATNFDQEEDYGGEPGVEHTKPA